MGLPRSNTVVRVNAKGKMQIFVDGKMIAGVTSVVAEGWPDATLKIEVNGRFVRFEQEDDQSPHID